MSEHDHSDDHGHGHEHEHHAHGHEHHEHGDGGRRVLERHCDVAVIGGSAAGLAAALQLGRQRRSVIVIDAGQPRNAPAAHMHGYLGHEGLPPGELLAIARDEVRSYGGEILSATATDVERLDGPRLRVTLDSGTTIVARRVLAATGLVDELPDIDGIADHWGRDVIHCPFCHGYEVRDQRVVQIVTHPMGLHPTPLFRQLTDRLTVVLHGEVDVDESQLAALRDGGIDVVAGTVHRLVDDGTSETPAVRAVELADGTTLAADAVVVGTRFTVRAEPLAGLGLDLTPHPSGLGDHVATDATGATAIEGVYAAGNVTDPSQQVLHAAANGSWIGAMISFGLAQEDLAAPTAIQHGTGSPRTSAHSSTAPSRRTSGNERDWDQRYGGDRMWSGNPNGTLVHEVAGLAPGQALDVGAGEGGDAIWLAEQGWTVTASDISQRGLDRVAAAAADRGLDVTCLRADANDRDPFGGETFDLVIAFYASIPRTPDHRAVRNLLGAVAPGGTLLVVSHDRAAMHGRQMAFDPDAYVRVDDVVDALGSSAGWRIETHERRDRPAGAASASHHVHYIVLRARRD